MPKYPKVNVQLAGKDGNAFSIIGRVVAALKEANVPYPKVLEFRGEATSGDYDHLLQTVMEWVNVDSESNEDEEDFYDEDDEPVITGEI